MVPKVRATHSSFIPARLINPIDEDGLHIHFTFACYLDSGGPRDRYGAETCGVP